MLWWVPGQWLSQGVLSEFPSSSVDLDLQIPAGKKEENFGFLLSVFKVNDVLSFRPSLGNRMGAANYGKNMKQEQVFMPSLANWKKKFLREDIFTQKMLHIEEFYAIRKENEVIYNVNTQRDGNFRRFRQKLSWFLHRKTFCMKHSS